MGRKISGASSRKGGTSVMAGIGGPEREGDEVIVQKRGAISRGKEDFLGSKEQGLRGRGGRLPTAHQRQKVSY